MTNWCRDISRDEAVRAAEDGRSGPLPTLEEAIATITQKGNGMATKAEIQATAYRAEASSERTEGVTERRPPEPGGGGNVTGAHFDDLANMSLERDAAIRERDNLRAERITLALTADRFASAVAEADTLRARVAELEAAAKLAPAANADAVSNPQPISGAGKSAGEETQAASGAAAPGWLTAEVVLPRVYCHGGDGEPLVDLEDVHASLAAAGVKTKEVGRE